MTVPCSSIQVQPKLSSWAVPSFSFLCWFLFNDYSVE
jgi:hypothetical protein